jgi:enamine deaminase RidA (YjgF/YER057c/UK114 family)
VSELPISQTRVHGDLVFTAGQVGSAADGSVPAEFGAQAELALESLARRLEEAGASIASVLKSNVFVVRAEDIAAMNEIYARHFSAPWPVRSTIVTALARPELLFEIEVVAARVEG